MVRTIAEAICARFEGPLHAWIDLKAQQWWHGNNPRTGWFDRPRFVDLDHVYGNGEFTWDGLWTVADPPPETQDELISTWEISPGPISRWHLPVRPGARVWEIHRPADWVRLVEAYPKMATRPHEGWELPGAYREDIEVDDLLAVSGQNAARGTIGRHLLPDWAAVAADYDGVHLSWAGFVTAEGYVSDVKDGGATMLRYWGSERTLWLADVFGDPEPLGAPVLSGRVNNCLGVDVRVDDARQAQDLDVITRLLGR